MGFDGIMMSDWAAPMTVSRQPTRQDWRCPLPRHMNSDPQAGDRAGQSFPGCIDDKVRHILKRPCVRLGSIVNKQIVDSRYNSKAGKRAQRGTRESGAA